jgi:ribosome-associated protein
MQLLNIDQLEKVVIDALEDIKGHNIIVYNTERKSNLFKRLVIATGTSNRHTRALIDNVRIKVKEAGETIIGTEGEDTGEWVLLDMGDIVVHVMQEQIRTYYNLEDLWGK